MKHTKVSQLKSKQKKAQPHESLVDAAKRISALGKGGSPDLAS